MGEKSIPQMRILVELAKLGFSTFIWLFILLNVVLIVQLV